MARWQRALAPASNLAWARSLRSDHGRTLETWYLAADLSPRMRHPPATAYDCGHCHRSGRALVAAGLTPHPTLPHKTSVSKQLLLLYSTWVACFRGRITKDLGPASACRE